MKDDIRRFLLGRGMDLVGFADAARFQAPQGHNPTDILEGCRSVVVFAKAIPKGIFEARQFRFQLYLNAYERYFATMDELALELSSWLEERGYLSVPIPSCTPIPRRNGLYRGILSLKHAAELAGLGKFGKNQLLLNDRYGPRLRLSALLTRAELEPDPPGEEPLCPESCSICLEVCSPKAIRPHGFDQPRCLQHCMSHPLLSLSAVTRFLPQRVSSDSFYELVTNTLGRPFQVTCIDCLIHCPRYQKS